MRVIRLLAAFPLLAFASCTKDDPGNGTGTSPELIPLSFEPRITATTEGGQTRAAVSGTEFGSGTFNFGMFIVRHESSPSVYEPQLNGYNNLQAVMTGSGTPGSYSYTWKYSLNGISGTKNGIGLVDDPAGSFDFYAYYPYTEGSDFTPEAVPFTSGSNDYMWTPRQSQVECLLSGGVIPVSLSFQHVMTLLQFNIRLAYTGNSTLTAIKLTDTRGRLVGSGTFNATTGEIDRDQAAGELTTSFGTNLRTSAQSFHVMFPEIPTGIADGEITVTLILDGRENIETFTIPLSMLEYTDGGTQHGFRMGYKYVVDVVVSNYVKFTPIEVIPWDDTPVVTDYEI